MSGRGGDRGGGSPPGILGVSGSFWKVGDSRLPELPQSHLGSWRPAEAPGWAGAGGLGGGKGRPRAEIGEGRGGGGKAREGGGESFLGQEPGPPLAEPARKAIPQMEGIKWEGEGPTVIAREGGSEACMCARACVWEGGGRQRNTSD